MGGGEMSEIIRVLVADDHAIVREGLRALLSTEPGMQLVGEAADGEEAIRLYQKLRPDLLLLDIKMPRKDGILVTREIRRLDPQARILIITSFSEEDQVIPAIKAGALGYLLKDMASQELLQAIREVRDGKAYLHPAIARKVLSEVSRPAEKQRAEDLLSEREITVLRLLAEGLTNQEIANRLVISDRTVRNHVGSILSKLDLDNRTQAALFAIKRGFVEEDSTG